MTRIQVQHGEYQETRRVEILMGSTLQWPWFSHIMVSFPLLVQSLFVLYRSQWLLYCGRQ